MNKIFVTTAALLGALSVALGAFAAHRLRTILPTDAVSTFETGVRYQFYHALALLMIGIASDKFSPKWIRCAGNCFIIGIILFSGSLYALTVLRITDTSANYVGIITPFGGLFFIAGWLMLFIAANKKE